MPRENDTISSLFEGPQLNEFPLPCLALAAERNLTWGVGKGTEGGFLDGKEGPPPALDPLVALTLGTGALY